MATLTCTRRTFDHLRVLTSSAQASDKDLYHPALEKIKEFIKTSTSSMTAVPKPLKFLRPHYENFEKAYESWPAGDNKVCNHHQLTLREHCR